MRIKSKITQRKVGSAAITEWLHKKGFKADIAFDCQNECQEMKVFTAKRLLALRIGLKVVGKATGLSAKELKALE